MRYIIALLLAWNLVACEDGWTRPTPAVAAPAPDELSGFTKERYS
jgi:hypothetical protein